MPKTRTVTLSKSGGRTLPTAPRRRILSADITHISLCPRGANHLPVIYKSDDGKERKADHVLDTLVKDNIEEGEITSIVYAPDKVDIDGDVADSKAIKKMAEGFAKRGLGSIDLVHDGKALSRDDAYVSQSWIVGKNDSNFEGLKDYSGNPVDAEGAWAVVIKIESEQLRKLYREGKWNGVSMFGAAEIKAASEDGLLGSLVERIVERLGLSRPVEKNGEHEMTITEKQLAEALEKNQKTTLDAVSKMMRESKHTPELLKKAGVKDGDTDEVVDLKVSLYKANNSDDTTPEGKKKTETKKTELKFEGDPTDEAAVAKFEYDVKKQEIIDKMDATDPASIREANELLAKLDAPEDDGDSDEVRDLKKRLSKAEAGSNQSNKSNGKNQTLSKEERQIDDAGKGIGALLRKSRGLEENPDLKITA